MNRRLTSFYTETLWNSTEFHLLFPRNRRILFSWKIARTKVRRASTIHHHPWYQLTSVNSEGIFPHTGGIFHFPHICLLVRILIEFCMKSVEYSWRNYVKHFINIRGKVVIQLKGCHHGSNWFSNLDWCSCGSKHRRIQQNTRLRWQIRSWRCFWRISRNQVFVF